MSDEMIGAVGAGIVVVVNAAIGAWVLLADKRQTRARETQRNALDDSFRIIDTLRDDLKQCQDRVAALTRGAP